MKRRDFLKGVTLAAAGGALAGPAANAAGIFSSPLAGNGSAGPDGAKVDAVKGLSPVRPLDPVVSRPVKVIIIGCGNRGRT